MNRFVIAIAALLFTGAGTPALAQSIFEKLTLERLGEVQPGSYLAGDNVKFELLGNSDGTFLLRFDGDPETYVLYTARASLGGRVLKYDSGETALQVAGWGGMTLYTDTQPAGLPAVRTGDATPPAPPNVSLYDLQNAAGDETQHLAYTRGLTLNFTTNWVSLTVSPMMRELAMNTLENTVRGIERYSISAQNRENIAHHIDAVTIEVSGKPALRLTTRTLVVTFNPNSGYEGRASSRAIARALSSVFPKH